MEISSSEHFCLKEDKLAELDAEITFKQKRLNDIDHKIERMDEKIDTLNDSINTLILKSQQDDSVLERRLVAIETQNKEHEKAINDNRNRFTLIISFMTIFFTVLTFVFNFLIR